MAYFPKPNDRLEINGIEFRHIPFPNLPHLAFGAAGARATVFYLLSPTGAPHGLKVFLPGYRTPRTAVSTESLLQYAILPGMQVCARTVLIPEEHYQKLAKTPQIIPPAIQKQLAANPNARPARHHGQLIQKHRDLEYAVLMPWVQGQDWKEIITGRNAIDEEKGFQLAAQTASVLANLERKELAHGDISSGNVKVDLNRDAPAVQLIDIEDLFAPGLSTPEVLSFGTSGYNHQEMAKGVWGSTMDRFAAAVLFAEMLGWCDDRVRQKSGEASFFSGSKEEMQTRCDRYNTLSQVLRDHYGPEVVDAFGEAWFSPRLEKCPTLKEWEQIFTPEPKKDELERVVEKMMLQAQAAIEKGCPDEAIGILEKLYWLPVNASVGMYRQLLLERGMAREKAQDAQAALKDYRVLLQMTGPEGLKEDLEFMIERLESSQNHPPR